MAQGEQTIVNIVIPFRGPADQLRDCLDGISKQKHAPLFEVVIVDDGSRVPVPAVADLLYDFPIRIVRQTALGISAARNHGISVCTGEVIVFVDSDVVLNPDFLERIAAAVARHPEDIAFQGYLVGGTRNLVEVMEDLRLRATLESLAEEDGYIAYLNTSAFAICRNFPDKRWDFFDLSAVRGEDTGLLRELMLMGKQPRLVRDAVASHRPRMVLLQYIFKHFLIGYHTQSARAALRNACAATLLDRSGRRGVANRMLALSSGNVPYQRALPMVAVAHGIERLGRSCHDFLGFKHGRRQIFGLLVDGVRENELVARISTRCEKGDALVVTYLTAWSIVQAKRDSSMFEVLRKFDICYPDGMGVIFSTLLLGSGKIQKVTANNFIWQLCQQAAISSLPVALVGAKPEVICKACDLIRKRFPTLDLVGCFDGYMTDSESGNLISKLVDLAPRLIIVGMGQPLQEKWVMKCRESLGSATFLCVGGLFDYLAGVKPSPPLWIRKSGFEWLFILIMRPRPFWRRYVFGIPMLGLMILREWLLKAFRCGPPAGGSLL